MVDLAGVLDFLVFDFDGTICDSADVKTEAFYQLYLDEQGDEFAVAVRDYHLANVGVSRFDKIRYCEEEMLGRPCSDQRMKELADRFGSIVTDRVIASPLVRGAAEFFSLFASRVTMLVASATPTGELQRIIAERGMSDWFNEVQGSPASKADIIQAYLDRRDGDPAKVVMVGDQPADLEAACAAGVHFVGFRPEGEARIFGDKVVVVDDMRSLPAAIRRIASGTSD